jgi:predicted alpha/beta-hydrolase family hydrolase
MPERLTTIDLGPAGAVTAIETPPEGHPSLWRFLYAPGASADVNDPFGAFACRAVARAGISAVRIQFPYQEAGRRTPDRPDTLEATWSAAIDQLSMPGDRLVVGGRSMGGRIASQVVAKGSPVDALALFSYPLHPPGRPERRRDEHLPQLGVPVLFCSGTNDAFASPKELSEAAALVAAGSVHLLGAADHGFNVRRSSGRTREDVWQEAVEAMRYWLATI